MTHADDREAITALAARIRRRDLTEPADREDPEVLAAEYVTALRQHGWRPTAAGPTPVDADWRTPHQAADPDTAHQRAQQIRATLRGDRP